MYHRIADEACDPWGLCVSPRYFEQHMEVLRKSFSVIPIRRMSESLADRTVSHRSVTITFDDGYGDNIHAARPILERVDLPATFFLISDYLGRRVEFWWDELDRLLLQPGSLPDRLEVSVHGRRIQASLGEAACYSQESVHLNRHWRAWQDPPTPRHSLYYWLWKELRPMSREDREQILEKLRHWANTGSRSRTSRRTLSNAEVFALSKDRLIEIGCHTMTHPQLSSLSPSMQSEEIRGCKKHLEEIVGRPVKSFAYPYGDNDDYTAETVSIVRSMGFFSACSTVPGPVTQDSDPFQLPRMPVENWKGEEFEKRLSEWFGSQ